MRSGGCARRAGHPCSGERAEHRLQWRRGPFDRLGGRSVEPLEFGSRLPHELMVGRQTEVAGGIGAAAFHSRTQQPDRFLAPGGAHYPLVTIRFEEQLQRIPVVVVVIDDKDARDV